MRRCEARKLVKVWLRRQDDSIFQSIVIFALPQVGVESQGPPASVRMQFRCSSAAERVTVNH